MFCRSCGQKIPDKSERCPVCGTVQSITEREYRTGSKSRAGAAVTHFRELSVYRQAALILETLGALSGLGGILFAELHPDAAFTVGLRAVVCLLGIAMLLGFGIALCVTLSKRSDREV